MLQVVATIAMEPSATFFSDAVRDGRAKLLRSIHVMQPEEIAANTARGAVWARTRRRQAGAGVPRGKGVKPDSQTETYAAATFMIENWRWAAVPFYIRTGKYLPSGLRRLRFNGARRPSPFSATNSARTASRFRIFSTLRIQPEEGISLKFSSKHSRPRHDAAARFHGFQLRFRLRGTFAIGLRNVAARRDHRRCHAFHTVQDMVVSSWIAVQPILDYWIRTQKFAFLNYAAGHRGPAAGR